MELWRVIRDRKTVACKLEKLSIAMPKGSNAITHAVAKKESWTRSGTQRTGKELCSGVVDEKCHRLKWRTYRVERLIWTRILSPLAIRSGSSCSTR